VLLPVIAGALGRLAAVDRLGAAAEVVKGVVREPAGRFAEEERSRQPSIFSVLRAVVALFHHRDEPHLGLYGAFGYDLAFQFEPIRPRRSRRSEQRDLVLYLPDELIVVDHRQIEMYARLIHTVDHVEGRLQPGRDALDAFLAHAWAVTVTGAPKAWAMQFIEDHERSPRAWYGGAVGFVGFDGNLNTGLTLRTIHVQDGVAAVRAGATLLYDSDPAAEEAETELKASAFLEVIRRRPDAARRRPATLARPGAGRRVLLVDHQDSFVHTLANYLRQTGAEVVTLRSGFPAEAFDDLKPHLAVLSPGPGTPRDFDVASTLDALVRRRIPVFGVCLGLQAMVEYFGGTLGVLASPVHGKLSRVRVRGGRLFTGLPSEFTAGRYHSLYAIRASLPAVLEVTADGEDGVVMAIEHVTLPLAAVQFHPESIMTLDDDVGFRVLTTVVDRLASPPAAAASPVTPPTTRCRAAG
jgi:anthranilate synthase